MIGSAVEAGIPRCRIVHWNTVIERTTAIAQQTEIVSWQCASTVNIQTLQRYRYPTKENPSMSRFIPLAFVLVLLLSSLTACQPVQPVQAQTETTAHDPAQHEAAGFTDVGPEHHLIYTPENTEWRDGPGSLPPGAQFVVLEGNPAEVGVFTMRIKMPDGYQLAPHWHEGVERLTIISGVFHLGSGEEFNAENTTALGAGAYTAMPPGMRHFAVTEGETIVQLSSIGPWTITYVNPEDDPRP
jgi:hypothetical protein